MNENKEWTYFDENKGEWISPHLTLTELDARHDAGEVSDHTRCVNARMAQRGGIETPGIPYSMISRFDIKFIPQVDELHAAREGKPITVFSGPNNGGKTLLLKHLFSIVGHGGYLVGCNHFSQVDILNSRQRDKHEHRRFFENFMYGFQASQQNADDNELKLDQVLTGLKDSQRKRLFDTASALIGNRFSMERTDLENEFSPFYVSMDGENLRYGSSGTRLFLTVLGILLDERFSTLLIDEPEIGLSPRVQSALATFLYDKDRREQFCPHLKQLYIATHSHIFLDRTAYSNNFVVSKEGKIITAKPLHSVGDFHQLQFNMLGNELEALFMPSAIVIVEGESDAIFIGKVVQLHLPNRKVAIVRSHGEGEVLKKLNYFRESFGDLAASPYRDRLFVLFDKKISTCLGRIQDAGVPTENVVVLSKNGIEYFYPAHLIARAFACDEGDVPTIKLENDPIEFNGHRFSKKDLSAFVAAGLTAGDVLHAELDVIVKKLQVACT